MTALDKMEEELMNVNNIHDRNNLDGENLLFNKIPWIKNEIKEIKEEIELLGVEGKKIEENLKTYLKRLNEIIWKYKDLWKDLKKTVIDILLKEILIDEEKNEEKRYRHLKDRKTEWWHQKQILKIDLMWEFQFIYRYNKALWKQQ